MEILVVGLNHRTSPVEVREKLAFSNEELTRVYFQLIDFKCIKEASILSTCNRVEVYSWANEHGISQILNFFEKFKGISKEELKPFIYVYKGEEAVKHIFRVASSLDSMVLGEPQIVGQFKDAFELAMKEEATGVVLNQLLKKALSVSKRVRTETAIGESAISVSYAAVELAKKIFGDLEKRKALLVGAGEMAELAAKHLINQGISEITVVNRTYERGKELAETLGGKAAYFDDLYKEMINSDIIITSAAAHDYVVEKDQIHKVMKKRKLKPMFFIDIAVPRNVDPEVGKVENVYLYDIDDLEQVVEENRKRREKEAQKAERIVKEEVENFIKWLKSQEVVPVIVSLRNWCERIREEELKKTLGKLKLEEKEQKALEALTTAIVNKILHSPLSYLKKSAAQGEGEKAARHIKEIFSLEEDNETKNRHKRK